MPHPAAAPAVGWWWFISVGDVGGVGTVVVVVTVKVQWWQCAPGVRCGCKPNTTCTIAAMGGCSHVSFTAI